MPSTARYGSIRPATRPARPRRCRTTGPRAVAGRQPARGASASWPPHLAGAIGFRHEGFGLVAGGTRDRVDMPPAPRIAFDRASAVDRRIRALDVDPLRQTAVAPDRDRRERRAAGEQGFGRAPRDPVFFFVDAGTVTCGLLRPVRTGSLARLQAMRHSHRGNALKRHHAFIFRLPPPALHDSIRASSTEKNAAPSGRRCRPAASAEQAAPSMNPAHLQHYEPTGEFRL